MLSVSPIHKPEVLVTRSDFSQSAVELLKQHFKIELWDNVQNGPIQKEKLIQLLKGKFGIFCSGYDILDAEVIVAGAPSLRVIGTQSAGIDHVDLRAVKDHNVRLSYSAGVNAEATAEFAVALLLATSRRVIEACSTVKNGGWNTWTPTWLCGYGLHGSIVGIIGYGRVGHSIAVKLKTFSPEKILYTSRVEKSDGTEIGAVFSDLDSLLRSSDFVILSMGLTPETEGFMNRDRIALMKKNAIFVNIGRGALVDQEALTEALEQRKILAAGLDVMTPEPLPVDHPLQKLDNCVISPHIGGKTFKAQEDMAFVAARDIIAVWKGAPMKNEYIFGPSQ